MVSKGPKQELVIVPKLIGLKEKEAENALIAYQLIRGTKRKEPSDEYPEGGL